MNPKNCVQKGHENLIATHLCIAKDCTQLKKWCCIKCINSQGVHHHKNEDQPHIIGWEELIILKKQEIIKFQQQDYKYYLRCSNQLMYKGILQCQEIYKILQEYLQFIEQQKLKMQNEKLSLLEIIQDLKEEKFIELNDERISDLLNFNQNKFIQNLQIFIQPQEHINEKILQLKNFIQHYQLIWNKRKYPNNIKLMQYELKLIDQTDSLYNASDISDNEQYLAYGGEDAILKIYDLNQERIIKQFNTEKNIFVCHFTSNSQQLFVGSIRGYVYGYDVLEKFKQIFTQQIHDDIVTNIKTVQNQFLITCSSDRSIIKTDIKSRQQIFKYIVHTQFIIAIDYDNINDLIISGSHDKSIKLWNCKRQCIIFGKELSHPKQIRQIQFINNNQNALSLDSDHNLYKWKIDLEKKEIIKIQEFRDPHKIFNFYQVNQNQYLILTCGNSVKILDEKGETLKSINYLIEDFSPWMKESRQPCNYRYIQIRTTRKLLVAKSIG